MTIETKPWADAFKSFSLHELIAKSHQRARADLLRQAAFEEEMAQVDYERALAALTESLTGTPVAGAPAKIVSVSYEQVILALPGDLLWVCQRSGSKWTEHLYGAPVENIEDAVAHFKRRREIPEDASFENLNPDMKRKAEDYVESNRGMRFAGDGSALSWPKVNVAPVGDALPPGAGEAAGAGG